MEETKMAMLFVIISGYLLAKILFKPLSQPDTEIQSYPANEWFGLLNPTVTKMEIRINILIAHALIAAVLVYPLMSAELSLIFIFLLHSSSFAFGGLVYFYLIKKMFKF